MRDWYYVNSRGNSPRECALLVVIVPSQDEYGQLQRRWVFNGKAPHLMFAAHCHGVSPALFEALIFFGNF